MIKYEFLDNDMYSESYIESLSDTYELVIDPNCSSYFHKYNVLYQPMSDSEKTLFCCNNRYELKIWLDLNGFKFNTCKIFYSDRDIEYASIILKKNEIKTEI